MSSPRRRVGGFASASDPRADEFLRELENVSAEIRDPVFKLRYIRASLAHYAGHERRVRRLPWSALRRVAYRRLSAKALDRMVTDPREFRAPKGIMSEPLGSSAAPQPRQRRPAGLTTMVVVAALGGVGALAHYAVQSPEWAARAATGSTQPSTSTPPTLPEQPATAPTAGVWLVESGRGFEQYSNGLRIDTSMGTKGDPRVFHAFSQASGLVMEPYDEPIGILFHTSESDIWPMEESYNENLRDSSHKLLRYIQRKRLYNYVIDRFGRVFRLVEESAKANHAGHSIWADGDSVYLNMNHAFLAVCFETRWEGGHALPITQAQLAGARALTAHLRQRWKIPPRRCVTHGIASVNATKHLIGHHLDWARGFPFDALGLPNAYTVPAPSVALFGFEYDDDFLKVMGKPWPGVLAAERGLREEATQTGKSIEDLRRDKQRLYDRWLEEQKRADEGVQRSAATTVVGVRGG